MCELLGLSAEQMASFTCSLNRFAAHGSATVRNHDGWGVTAYEGRDALVASVPLTAEPWRPLAEGELVVIGDGRVV